MGAISSGYTVCNLDTSYKQVTYSTLQSVKEAGTSTDGPAPLYSLTAQGEPELREVERIGPLLLPCAHMSPALTLQQLDSAPNNFISKEVQQWKQETNPCGCVVPPSPAPQYSLSKGDLSLSP